MSAREQLLAALREGNPWGDDPERAAGLIEDYRRTVLAEAAEWFDRYSVGDIDAAAQLRRMAGPCRNATEGAQP